MLENSRSDSLQILQQKSWELYDHLIEYAH